MTPEFTIRRATPDDVDILVGFNVAMAQETEDKALAVETLGSGLRALLEDPALGFYLVAESSGRPVGQIMVTSEWSDWRNAHFWWLQSLYVKPEYRRQGVFRQLFDYVQRRAREAGDVCGIRLYVERTNHRAQQAYVNLGMAHSHYDMYEIEF